MHETISEFKSCIIKTFKDGGLPEPTDTQLFQFGTYFNFLLEENKKYNLTAITDTQRAATDHFYDSAIPLCLIPEGSKVIDIGTGAGFPVIPLAIMRPNASYIAVDSTEKKCAFLKNAAALIGANIDVICGRAEQLGKTELRGTFDVCVSRAVARLNKLAELCAPFLRIEGRFFAYKSDPQEIVEAGVAAVETGLELDLCVPSMIPGNGHRVFIYKKIKDTPEKYPRSYSKIKKSPL